MAGRRYRRGRHHGRSTYDARYICECCRRRLNHHKTDYDYLEYAGDSRRLCEPCYKMISERIATLFDEVSMMRRLEVLAGGSE
jgi:hypothetical protein